VVIPLMTLMMMMMMMMMMIGVMMMELVLDIRFSVENSYWAGCEERRIRHLRVRVIEICNSNLRVKLI